MAPLYALHVFVWACIACLWAREAHAGTFPSFDSTPKTVNQFQDALTTAFLERTALLLADTTSVVGGTGSAEGRLVFIECYTPATECFPASGEGEYVGVLEEGLLPNVLQVLAVDRDAVNTGSAPSIPSALIVLPSSEDVSFSPAPVKPLVEYQPGPSGGPAQIHNWNLGGADVLDVAVPFGVFLAPSEEAAVIRKHTKSNGVRGSNGAEYGSSVHLESRIDLESNSTECVPAGTCAPMGGYSVWASIPPQSSPTGADRRQLLVLTHWDSQGLFRSVISGLHSAQSGLVAMLLAADILQKNGGSGDYEKDIILTALSGDAFDLMASRKLLYDLQHKEEGTPAASNLEGFDLSRLDSIVEVGMLGYDAGAHNGTGGSGGDLFLHSTTTQSAAADAFLAVANTTADSPTVQRAGQDYLPPSSLLLWQQALPNVDAVYLGDFDSEFSNQNFWDHRDTGLSDWSASQTARSAAILAAALHTLAAGTAAPTGLQIDQQDVEAHAKELFACLGSPSGLECDLVKGMMSPSKDAAEQFVSLLASKPDDEQDRSRSKKNIEAFIWEYLANRTYTGEAEQVTDGDKMVDCRHTKQPCTDGLVCLHEFGGEGKAGGKCVNASVKFTPSHSTLFEYRSCEEDDGEKDRSCEQGWDVVADDEPSQWASDLGLPEDKGWAETFNTSPTVDVNLRESSSRDRAVLIAGIGCTAVVLAVVLGAKALHRRFKID